ncbi:MAG: hypothetical protein Q7S87_09150 [Agitococcus sp.]|nr:hypothetical protein [Agitococcus sp.]MDO9177068.1 hypothetical protein [Agitococcus sp.]
MKRVLLLLSVAFWQTCFAVTPSPPPTENPGLDTAARVKLSIHNSLVQIDRAYARRQVVLDDSGHPPTSAASQTQLFPQYGFAPRGTYLTWALAAITDDQSRICARTIVQSMEEWTGALSGYKDSGFLAAQPGCSALSSFSIPTQYPATLWGTKVLDRRDYPVPTIVPAYPVLSGFTAGHQVLPAITMTAAPYQNSATVALDIYNPPIIVATTPVVRYKETGIAPLVLREGFSAVHNCSLLQGGDTCHVMLTYHGSAPLSSLVGVLRLDFITGEFAVISLRGKTTRN